MTAASIGLVLLGLGGLYLGTVVFGRLPLRPVLKFIFSILVGGVLLAVLRPALALFGWDIPLNPVTASVVGVLQLPGLILLILLSHFFA
ncbi:MAG: pro-sigmaK processing inhibitor BofA family protein [Peptococcaceae bacterium]|jgi:inhibitor of the pro-sigma K processing machinery|nr:pro-sigmaK processing inhibitor BofA family protein [Peptococcaceae bacterium]